jgi:ribosomal protein S20
MPITSSATKALRASKRKRIFNIRHKADIEKTLKSFRKLVTAKNKAEAQKMIPSIYKTLDKAAKIGYIKANAASRMKSRVMAALKKISV